MEVVDKHDATWRSHENVLGNVLRAVKDAVLLRDRSDNIKMSLRT